MASFEKVGLKWVTSDVTGEGVWYYDALSKKKCSASEQMRLTSYNPSDGKVLGEVWTTSNSVALFEGAITSAQTAAIEWAKTPTPIRAEVVRKVGNAFREFAPLLAQLLCYEIGKIPSEALGEVQEVIDVCDYAAGLGRQIDGSVMPSERASHILLERWHPLGVIGVITAFNFPVAVTGWNTAIALVCGNSILWKPSPSALLVSAAFYFVLSKALKEAGAPDGLFQCCLANNDFAEIMAKSPSIKLLSFTGSTAVGKQLSLWAHQRLGKVLLELGGNNASIVMPDADLHVVAKASAFAAVGTAGQRCTTLRRLIIHASVYDEVVTELVNVYKGIKVGSTCENTTGFYCGPLRSKEAKAMFLKAVEGIKAQGGKILYGGTIAPVAGNGYFVVPTIVETQKDADILNHELFAPILYVLKFETLEEAIQMNNSVPQGLSSSIYTKDIGNVFEWIGPLGSDCGIVNVNLGPSGAEIGGAFGGEKDTGGGRESGSDAWKQYMRRITVAINYSNTVALAQGIQLD